TWPEPGPEAIAALDRVLTAIPAGGLVLLDGLIAGAPPGISERHAGRLLIVILVHAILSDLGRPDGVGEGGDAGGLARAEFERGEAAALAGARAIITTSSWAKNELVDRFALAARSVHVVRPGVDAPVEPAPAEPALQ